MNELLWVAVPGGIAGGVATLRVVVVPRIRDTSLARAGMADWPPPALVSARLAVDFAPAPDGAVATATVDPPHVRAQPGLWRSFFSTIGVRPYGSALTEPPPVQVADTTGQASAIRTTFEESAKARVTLDPATRPRFHTAVREQLQAHWSGPEPPPATPPPPGPPAVDPPDFHRAVSMLREHPAVLQALGLIFELRIPQADVRPSGVVQVRWPGAPPPPGFPAIVSPWTRYSTSFRPASTATVSDGMLALTDDGTGWQIVTVDVDGGARRMREAARAVGGDAAIPATLPALRTAGLLLVRTGRADDLAARRQSGMDNAGRASMGDAVLDADSLLLGYRLDVQRFGGEWLSLHQRRAEYKVDGVVITTPDPVEEGHLKAHTGTRDAHGTVQTDEVLARWSGWSLAVRQPTFDGHEDASGRAPHAPLPFDFSFHFAAKERSLPRLRFTKTYVMRARVVDLAGGGLHLDDPAADRCVSAPVTYRRYEPVSSPDVVLPDGSIEADFGPGEAVDRLVIRSDPAAGLDLAAFAARFPRYVQRTRRVLLPPRTTLALAEQHAMFDGMPHELAFPLVRRAMALPGSAEAPLPDPAAGGVTAFPRREPGMPDAQLAAREWPPWPGAATRRLEFTERPAAAKALDWPDDVLHVRLRPAEQLTVELSSFLRGDFLDHFAVKELLPDEAETAANQGRHPMVTPARAVTLVHAVRRPLRDPGGTLAPRRQAGETFALLDATPALLGVDTASTGTLEVTASWREPVDDDVRDVAGAVVDRVTVDRGDADLHGPLRHEFGDTRHRTVTYTLRAISRFRPLFAEDDDAAFVAETVLPPVSVRSTARPQPPILLSTVPAFAWDRPPAALGETATHRRRGGLLRVELKRPWFLTGDGEMLAVVVGATNAPPVPLRPFLTQSGRDPIWNTPGTDHWLTANAFADTAGPVATVALPEAGASVVVVPYRPLFASGRWYADIALPTVAGAVYSPFVQLALARYQPQSLDGLELSQVVHAETVQLLPDRSLEIDRTFENIVSVTLSGPGPQGPRNNRVDLILERCALPPGMPASAADLTAIGGPAVGAPGGDVPAWVPVASASRELGLGISVSFPPGVTGPLRIRVREVELIGADGQPPAAPGSVGELTERVVFTEVAPL